VPLASTGVAIKQGANPGMHVLCVGSVCAALVSAVRPAHLQHALLQLPCGNVHCAVYLQLTWLAVVHVVYGPTDSAWSNDGLSQSHWCRKGTVLEATWWGGCFGVGSVSTRGVFVRVCVGAVKMSFGRWGCKGTLVAKGNSCVGA
jgi:hypothetical protein